MVQVNKDSAQGDGGCAQEQTGCCSELSHLLSPELFKAFADPKRLSLLVRLAEARRPCTVTQVAEGSGVDLSVVSRHLAVLREAGVISCVKEGKEVWCSLQPSAVAALLRNLADALESCCPTEGRMTSPASTETL
jgi:DNA-binding transcriptional ArsR family regulator